MATIFGYAPDLPTGIEDRVRTLCEGTAGTETGVSRIGNLVITRILSAETWRARKAIYKVWEALRLSIAGNPARHIRNC